MLFMSLEDVNMLLETNSDEQDTSSKNLELYVQIERGPLDSMENFDHCYDACAGATSQNVTHPSDKVTIIVDPNKGIYSLEDTAHL